MGDEVQTVETCKFCKSMGPHDVVPTPETQHHAKLECGSCHRWIRWLPKPESDASKYRRPAAHRDLVEKYGRGFCELCLRSKKELPASHSLHGHHVIEYKDGGEPERQNVWILCTACHSLVNWVRRYLPKILAEQSVVLPTERDANGEFTW